MNDRQRIEALEREVAELRREIELLRILFDAKVPRSAPWVPPQLPIPEQPRDWWGGPTCTSRMEATQ